jgi:hypothetical protein
VDDSCRVGRRSLLCLENEGDVLGRGVDSRFHRWGGRATMMLGVSAGSGDIGVRLGLELEVAVARGRWELLGRPCVLMGRCAI